MKTKDDEFGQAVDELKLAIEELSGCLWRIRKVIDEATDKGEKLPW